jgi:hypothetical protein
MLRSIELAIVYHSLASVSLTLEHGSQGRGWRELWLSFFLLQKRCTLSRSAIARTVILSLQKSDTCSM